MLAAGPFAERSVYDAKAAAKQLLDESRQAATALHGATAPVSMPWEVDGRAWHTRDRVTRTGKPVRWEGKLLEGVVDRIQVQEGVPAVDWSQRSLARIPAKDPGQPAFFEAYTAHEWIITLRFRLPRNTFKKNDLADRLELKPFAESAPPVLSDAPRIEIQNWPTGQEVVFTGHAAADFETPAFAEFLARAVAAAFGGKTTDESSAPGWIPIHLDTPPPRKKRSS